MDIYEAMSTLRAVRRLKPDPIDDDIIERILPQQLGRRPAAICSLGE